MCRNRTAVLSEAAHVLSVVDSCFDGLVNFYCEFCRMSKSIELKAQDGNQPFLINIMSSSDFNEFSQGLFRSKQCGKLINFSKTLH